MIPSFLLPEAFRPRPPPLTTAQDWEEMKTKFAERILLNAESWKPFTLHDVPLDPGKEGGIYFGKWRYQHVRFPCKEWLSIAQGGKRAKCGLPKT